MTARTHVSRIATALATGIAVLMLGGPAAEAAAAKPTSSTSTGTVKTYANPMGRP